MTRASCFSFLFTLEALLQVCPVAVVGTVVCALQAINSSPHLL